MPSRFSCVRQFATLWTVAQFSLCEDSPGKATGVGCHALVQGIFLTRDGTQGALGGRFFLGFFFLPLAPPGKPAHLA